MTVTCVCVYACLNRGMKPTTITRCDKQMTFENKPHRNAMRAEMTETHRIENEHTHTHRANSIVVVSFWFKDMKCVIFGFSFSHIINIWDLNVAIVIISLTNANVRNDTAE